MNLKNRIELLEKLKAYIQENGNDWQVTKSRATAQNGWFTPEFIELATANICNHILGMNHIMQWADHYHLDDNIGGKNVGIVMAGNIPLVGFHDFLTAFLSGHKQTIKLSSKDDVLLKHLAEKLCEWDTAASGKIVFADMLRGCDAYIATGSNNSARYFEQYFSKYPHIIRRNRTSVAILTGNEDAEALDKLADDVHLYFGLGCRNVTKVFVPGEYDFVPLLRAFDKYKHFADHNKYKNNYDYQLSLALLNNKYYMTNGSILLLENESIFSPISQLHYSYYRDLDTLKTQLAANGDIQCIVGEKETGFGQAQSPGLFDYADGVDTMAFLLSL
ncbi:MAG: acyl-CoA reductase [Ferruginibacter sp.]